MSDEASPGVTGNSAVGAGTHLTPEVIETVLNDFRGWLQQCATTATAVAQGSPTTGLMEEPGFSLQTLTAEFTALRQEVNLMTRATRTQQEQTAEALRQLGETVEALEAASTETEERQTEALRPLLKTLVDVYDALALARREVQRVETAVQKLAGTEEAEEPEPPALPRTPAAPVARRWWHWWSGRSTATEPEPSAADLQAQLAWQRELAQKYREERAERRKAAEQVRQFFTSVVTGYTMGLQRIDRALQQHQLEPIACVGEPFDPECMEVVEVVNEPGRSGTEVLEEVRRGYRWRGRLFRYAQVRVARP
jgi:molecular chaperone GrpE